MEYYLLNINSDLNLNRYDLFRDSFVIFSNGLIIKRVQRIFLYLISKRNLTPFLKRRENKVF
jgi:hypothetical protein